MTRGLLPSPAQFKRDCNSFWANNAPNSLFITHAMRLIEYAQCCRLRFCILPCKYLRRLLNHRGEKRFPTKARKCRSETRLDNDQPSKTASVSTYIFLTSTQESELARILLLGSCLRALARREVVSFCFVIQAKDNDSNHLSTHLHLGY